MKGWKITYGLLVALAVISYFMPWMSIGSESFPGWGLILPFSFPYFVGLILAIVVLFTEYKAVGLSIFAGILMIISILVSGVMIGFGAGLSAYAHSTDPMEMGSGFQLATLVSLVYVILGPIVGNKFKKQQIIIEVK